MKIFQTLVGAVTLVGVGITAIKMPIYFNGQRDMQLAQADNVGMDVAVTGSPTGGTTIGVNTNGMVVTPPRTELACA
jgi:hypothetical protein